MKHLLDTRELTREEAIEILDVADYMAQVKAENRTLNVLNGKTVVNLFFEDSTRTRLSFEAAEKRLGAAVTNFSASGSSLSKGESLKDTAQTLKAIAADAFVIRHSASGAPQRLAEAGWTDIPVLNAGDGTHAHPTQALLDLYSIWERKESFDGLKVGIVGDIGHSRVCGSLIPALKIMGAEVTVVAPGTLMPPRPDVLGADHVSYCLDDVLPELDVVYMLRIQRERLEGAPFPSLREYHQLFGLTQKRERLMKPDAIICHPGPINRGVEFDSYMADHPERSVILDQVYAGICVRMAALYLLLGGADNGLAS